jgi:hypothetical protein
MNHIKTIWKGEYGIQHHWYLDDFGYKRNSFDIIQVKNDGSRIYYPFFGRIRVNDINHQAPFEIGDNTTPFTDEEYIEMLNEQLIKIIK